MQDLPPLPHPRTRAPLCLPTEAGPALSPAKDGPACEPLQRGAGVRGGGSLGSHISNGQLARRVVGRRGTQPRKEAQEGDPERRLAFGVWLRRIEKICLWEKTVYVTFRAWNLLTSRGLSFHCPFSQSQLKKRRQALGLVRQDRSSENSAKKEENEMTNGFSMAREGIYLLSRAREFGGALLPKGRFL